MRCHRCGAVQWLETMLTPFSSSIVMMENAQQLCRSHLVVSWPHSSPGIICIKCSISSTIIPIMNGQYILQKIANIDICSGPLYQLDRMQGQGNSTNQGGLQPGASGNQKQECLETNTSMTPWHTRAGHGSNEARGTPGTNRNTGHQQNMIGASRRPGTRNIRKCPMVWHQQ